MHRLQILLGPMSFSLVKNNTILGNLKAGQREGTALLLSTAIEGGLPGLCASVPGKEEP